MLRYFEVEENEEILKSLIRAELDFAYQGDITDSKEDAALLKVKSAVVSEITQNQEKYQLKRSAPISRWLRICALWLVIASSTALLVNHFYKDIKGYFYSAKLYTIYTKPGERK